MRFGFGRNVEASRAAAQETAQEKERGGVDVIDRATDSIDALNEKATKSKSKRKGRGYRFGAVLVGSLAFGAAHAETPAEEPEFPTTEERRGKIADLRARAAEENLGNRLERRVDELNDLTYETYRLYDAALSEADHFRVKGEWNIKYQEGPTLSVAVSKEEQKARMIGKRYENLEEMRGKVIERVEKQAEKRAERKEKKGTLTVGLSTANAEMERFMEDNGIFESGRNLVVRLTKDDILPIEYPNKKILGVIRPAAEQLATASKSNHIGIFGTTATITSNAYIYELLHQNPSLKVSGVACPGVTDLIEAGKQDSSALENLVEQFARQLMNQDPHIDTALLACTHYPLVADVFKKYVPDHVEIMTQGKIVADKLADYLDRHPDISDHIDASGMRSYFTTGPSDHVTELASLFYKEPLEFELVEL